MTMTSSTPLRIGLTGGIGSGKSTVGQMLHERGAAVIDADAIARSVTAAHGAAMSAIAQIFGADFITPDGALNRERMRAHVFSHPEAKQALEAIIHPLVAQETQRQAQHAIANGHHTLVFDVPLLVESGARWRAQVDRVLVVDCLEETQIQRVMARNGWKREAVQAIISAQASRTQKLAAADWVIDNEGISLEALRTRVLSLPIEPT
jgi:dephospho-CoA kinase